jgi:hypothetical protein
VMNSNKTIKANFSLSTYYIRLPLIMR